MVGWKFKVWRTAGLAALAAACGPTATTAPPSTEPAPSTTPSGESGEAGAAAGAYAGLDGDARTAMHLQQLKGFVLVAERVLADTHSVEEAQMLVQQGLDEAYRPVSNEFGGFNTDFVRLGVESDADVSAHFAAGKDSIDTARNRLSFNHADITARMIDLSTGLYQAALTQDGVDAVEYRHSLGAALSARDALLAGRDSLRARNAAAYDEATAAIERYIALYPSSNAPTSPTPYRQMLAQSSRVRLALSAFL